MDLQQKLSINLTKLDLEEFCQRWKICELSLFGSALTQRFRPDSDVDIMVSFETKAPWGLLELVRIKRELETLIGREVDLVTKKSVEQSPNWIRRREILETAQAIYVAG